MREVSIKEARQNFKAIIDRVAMGEQVSILRRGKEVARLVPPAARTREIPAPSLAAFRRSIKGKGKPLSLIVNDERDDK